MSAEIVRKLSALGLNLEQVAGVMDIMDAEAARFEAAEEARKAQVRDRVQRWRDRQKDDVTLPKRNGNGVKRLTRVEDSSSKLDISGEDKKDDAAPSARPKATRIPDDFVPDEAWAVAEGLMSAQARVEAAQFLDFWRGKSGKDGTKQDWPATWRVWVRNSIKRLPTVRSGAPPNGKPKTIGDIFRDDAKRMGLIPDDQPPDTETRRMAAGNGSGEGGSTGIARRFAVAGDILGSIGPGSVLRRA